MPHKHEIEQYYEDQAAEYDREFYLSDADYAPLKIRHRYILEMVDALDLPDDARVLDVGCGPGEMVMDLIRADREVYGVDISAEMVGRAEGRLARRRGLTNKVVLAMGDIERLDFPDGFFDLVVASGVVEYLQDDEAWAREVTRTLKPGGYLILNVTNPLAVRKWTEPVTEAVKSSALVRRALGFVKERVLGKGALHYFPFRPRKHAPRAFDAFLASIGFRKVSHAYFDFSVLPAPLDLFTTPLKKRLERFSKRNMVLSGVGYIVCAKLAAPPRWSPPPPPR